jgi:hypothetical protein
VLSGRCSRALAKLFTASLKFPAPKIHNPEIDEIVVQCHISPLHQVEGIHTCFASRLQHKIYCRVGWAGSTLCSLAPAQRGPCPGRLCAHGGGPEDALRLSVLFLARQRSSQQAQHTVVLAQTAHHASTKVLDGAFKVAAQHLKVAQHLPHQRTSRCCSRGGLHLQRAQSTLMQDEKQLPQQLRHKAKMLRRAGFAESTSEGHAGTPALRAGKKERSS